MINSESLSISQNLRCNYSEVLEESPCSVQSELTKSQLLKKYSENHSEYINSIYVQEIDKIVRAISHNPILFQLYRSQSIYTLVSHTVQVLMLNLLEVSIYSQVLLQILNINQTLPAEYYFFYVGWAVKKIFCDDLQYYIEYLRTKFINFEENFQIWERTSGGFFNFSTKDLNLLFKEGRKGVFKMDLSFYVDQILQSSPPYQIESREVMKSILNEKTELSDEAFQRKYTEAKGQNFNKRAYEKINIALSKYTLETIDSNLITDERKDKDQFLLQISRLL